MSAGSSGGQWQGPSVHMGLIPVTGHTSTLPSLMEGLFVSTWIFIPKAMGPAVWIKMVVKKVLRTFLPFQHCWCLFTSVKQWVNTFLLFLLVVFLPKEPFLVNFHISGQFPFELSSCLSNCISASWQCSCSSHWVSLCFSIYGALLQALSRLKSSQLNQGGLSLIPSPLKDMNGFCASRRVFLKTSQHLLSPLSSMEASHRIPPNQALSKLKFSLLKFKTSVLILTFCVFSKIQNYNIVTSAAKAISSRDITKQYCI